MDVDFNNLRLQTMAAMDRLTFKLNNKIDEYGDIEISANSIQKDMDELRSTIDCFACCISDEYKEVYSTYNEGKGMIHFNTPNN